MVPWEVYQNNVGAIFKSLADLGERAKVWDDFGSSYPCVAVGGVVPPPVGNTAEPPSVHESEGQGRRVRFNEEASLAYGGERLDEPPPYEEFAHSPDLLACHRQPLTAQWAVAQGASLLELCAKYGLQAPVRRAGQERESE